MITVRRIRAEDVPALTRLVKPTRELHRRRLGMQARSIAVYLGAFDDEGPVGHALLKLPPLGTEHPRRHGIPEIEDLFVSAACRSQGIGRRLLHELEVVACRRGFDRVGLAVGIDNPRARTLYAGEGYVDAGLDPFWVEGAHETCTYLVKELL